MNHQEAKDRADQEAIRVCDFDIATPCDIE
jgi:hypothetical protein